MHNFRELFLRICTVILFLTAAFKALTVLSKDGSLSRHDPLFFFLSTKELMIGAAIMESAIGVALLTTPRNDHRILFVAWLTTCFSAYKIGLLSLGADAICPCFGNLYKWTNIAPGTVTLLSNAILLFMLVGSYYFLTIEPKENQEVKMPERH